MSYLSPNLWSDAPYAPQESYRVYFDEKTNLSGFLSGAIFYGKLANSSFCPHSHLRLIPFIIPGISFALFLQCISAFLDPINRSKGGIKWGMVVHTTLMFLVATGYSVANLNLQSISYVDNREFPGLGDGWPGPYNWQYLIYDKPASYLSLIMFLMNTWLADGLLVSSKLKLFRPPASNVGSSSFIGVALFTP